MVTNQEGSSHVFLCFHSGAGCLGHPHSLVLWKGWPRGWTGVDGTAVPGMTSLGLQLQAHPELVRMRGGSP